MLIYCCHLNFNSIKVQFERVVAEHHRLILCQFQFHKGTIWTNRLRESSFQNTEFQFHKGTIWTSHPIWNTYLCFYFNSIKVQFELPKVLPSKWVIHDFNSIKVQFELMASNPHIKTPAFQFHKGTIWTGQLSCEKFKYIFQFHKGTIWTCSTVWYLWFCTLFQFHKGTIWTHNTHYSRRVFYYFNSIKVQFERRNLRARILSYQIFQFHKGTIWTGRLHFLSCARSISIP